jgi:hypothetical protein
VINNHQTNPEGPVFQNRHTAETISNISVFSFYPILPGNMPGLSSNGVENFNDIGLARSIRWLQESTILLESHNVAILELNLNKLKEQRYILRSVHEQWNTATSRNKFNRSIYLLAQKTPSFSVQQIRYKITEIQNIMRNHMRNAYVIQNQDARYLQIDECRYRLTIIQEETTQLNNQIQAMIEKIEQLTAPQIHTLQEQSGNDPLTFYWQQRHTLHISQNIPDSTTTTTPNIDQEISDIVREIVEEQNSQSSSAN